MPQPTEPVRERTEDAADGLVALLADAAAARAARAEGHGESGQGPEDGTSAVCAWNHFENIPTFYNWNNRPR
jgi:hypothetical protein